MEVVLFFVFVFMVGVIFKMASMLVEVIEIFKGLFSYFIVVLIGFFFMIFIFYFLVVFFFVKKLFYSGFFW